MHATSVYFLRLQLFCLVESETFCGHLKHESICRKTVMPYLQNLTRHVQSKINTAFSYLIAIVFVGWSSKSMHFLGIFATYRSNNAVNYDEALLAFAPLENEATQGTAEHVDFPEFVLQLFGKEKVVAVAIIGYNELVNWALALDFQTRFASGHSHEFNLAIKEFLDVHSRIVDEIH